MSYNWATLEGREIEGGHTLRTFLREHGTGAEFDTGDSVQVTVLSADDPSAESELSRWSLSTTLSHPHLLRVVRAGRDALGDMPVVYCVTEAVEDRLADLVPDRPLDAAEARDVVFAVASALDYLHGRGLAHSGVNVDNIVAAGGRVKLTAGGITGDGSVTRDMRDFGATVVEVMTQRRTQDVSEVPASLPAPFRQIAIGCLQPDQGSRWTAHQVLEALEGRIPAAATPAEPQPEPTPEAVQQRRAPWALIAAVSLAALVLLVWLVTQPARPGAAVPIVEAPASLPSPIAKDLPVPEAPPPAVATAPAPATATVERSRSAGEWGVVAAAYRDYDAAARRAGTIADRWPGFPAGVFPNKGEGRKYYVVLGSSMNKPAADALLRKARSAGLPQDAYVTKLPR